MAILDAVCMISLWDAVPSVTWTGRSDWPSDSVSLCVPPEVQHMYGVLLRYQTRALDCSHKQVIPSPLSLTFLHFPCGDRADSLSPQAQSQKPNKPRA